MLKSLKYIMHSVWFIIKHTINMCGERSIAGEEAEGIKGKFVRLQRRPGEW